MESQPARQLIDLTKLKEAVNFYDLALSFDEDKLKVSYNNVTMVCPFHEEKTPSFVYNLEIKRFKCYGCGEAGDVFDYVAHKLKTKRLSDAIDHILRFTGMTKDNIGTVKAQQNTQVKSLMRSLTSINKKSTKVFDYFTEDDIRFFKESRGGWYKEKGFTDETLDFFEVGFNAVDKRITVPVRDEEGHLVGVTGRTIHKNPKELGIPKWKHYVNSDISSSFFNIHNAIRFSKDKNNGIIICEGPADVMWMHQCGYNNTVACLTNRISGPQKGVLLKNFINVFICLDGDEAGDNGKNMIVEELKGYFNLFVLNVPKGKDPDELGEEELKELFKNAKKI